MKATTTVLAILVLIRMEGTNVDASDIPGDSNPLILNQAADAIVGYLKMNRPLGKGATKEEAESALRRLVDQYEGTRVSHIFWNICYQRAAYRSDVWASYWDVPDPETQTVSWPRRCYQLHQLGIDDVFAHLIPYSRERGISPWVSLRMNDMHYYDDPNRMNPLWSEHPEYWMDKEPGFHNGFDFTQPAVRRHYLALVREATERWDVDGIELDWMRFPNLFKPGNEDAVRNGLTEFMCEVRKLTDAAEKRLGHTVGIAARVPATPECSHRLGMDAVAWTHAGCVDILIPGSLWRPSFPDVPVDEWKHLTGEKCSIIPGTDLWIGGRPGGAVAATGMAPIRGFTTSMLSRGADGIYLFNHFEPVTTELAKFTVEGGVDAGCTLHDLLALAGDPVANGPRRHVLTFHSPAPREPGYRPPLPVEIATDRQASFQLHLGTVPAGSEVWIRVGLDERAGFATATPEVALNGAPCTPEADLHAPEKAREGRHDWQPHIGALADRMLQFRAPPGAVRNGYNTIRVMLTGSPQMVVWLETVVIPDRP